MTRNKQKLHYTVDGCEVYDESAERYIVSCHSRHDARRMAALLNLAEPMGTKEIERLGVGWLDQAVALQSALRTALEQMVQAARHAYTRPGSDTMALADAEQAATDVLTKVQGSK